jgi:hypothetical protein
MTEIRIPVPRPPRGLGANLVGLVGLVWVALAVGGLTGNWWWSLLIGGVFAVGLSYIAQTHAAAAESDVAVPVAAAARTQPAVRAVPTPVSA